MTKSVMLGEISASELCGPLSDFMQKLQGKSSREYLEGFKKYLRKENPWPKKWREEHGVFYFSVTSPTHRELLSCLDPNEIKEANNPLGEAWIKRLQGNDFHVGYHAKILLRSLDFKPTNGVTTEVAILPEFLFWDEPCVQKKVYAEAKKRKLSKKPNADLACLICEKFTNEDIQEMGLLCIYVMHEPITGDGGFPTLLTPSTRGGGCNLESDVCKPRSAYPPQTGFAFEVSQVSAQR